MSSTPSGRRRVATAMTILGLALVGALSLAAFAAAGSATVGAARTHLSGPSGSRTETVAVNSAGVTVYWLSPETTHHLLCTSSACLQVWPPVKAGARLTRGAGVSGTLGRLHRRGFTQLTLNGHPLYTFVEDGGRRGVAAGDGLQTFGGTWRVLPER